MRKYLLLIAAAFSMTILAATPQSDDNDTADWEERLNTPEIPQRFNSLVSRHMERLAKEFKNQGLNAELVRKNEVIRVTIPVSELFAPNSTTLLPGAESKLKYFDKALSSPDSYCILVAVHSDDTGDEVYSDDITEKRADAVQDVMVDIISKSDTDPNLYIASFGKDEPRVPNNSIENRAKNRRIEIFLVPEKKLIDAARAGRL